MKNNSGITHSNSEFNYGGIFSLFAQSELENNAGTAYSKLN